MALESLFGPDNDTGRITHRLAQRISSFLADTPEVAIDLFNKVKRCYKTRSKIIHGRWEHDPDIDLVMADSEVIVRTVFRNLFNDCEMLRTFLSKQRNKFLEEWVASGKTEPPLYPPADVGFR
jgi:hypothetical protein